MKTLILGDGLLGSELHELTKWDLASRKLSNLDIDNLSKLKDLVSGYNNIVNCIANTDSYSDDKQEMLNKMAIKSSYKSCILDYYLVVWI